jgi:hypothetical protein
VCHHQLLRHWRRRLQAGSRPRPNLRSRCPMHIRLLRRRRVLQHRLWRNLPGVHGGLEG